MGRHLAHRVAVALLSRPQDKRQNDQSGFYGVSSPSARDLPAPPNEVPRQTGEGVGRGEALQTLHKNDVNRFKAPLSLAFSPLRRGMCLAPWLYV